MGLLLPIITKSIMGNNESITTHYESTQLADDSTVPKCYLTLVAWAYFDAKTDSSLNHIPAVDTCADDV